MKAGAPFDRYATAAVLAVACVLRLVAAWQRPLHIDEGVGLVAGSLPLNQIIPYLGTYDAHPPLTFLLIHALVRLGAPVILTRSIFALMGVASVALFMCIVRIWSTPRAAIVAGACAACMPDLVFYDGWIRMYAPAALFELTAMLLLSILATRDPAVPRRLLLWAGWAIASAAALYTLYLAWTMLAAQLLFAMTRRRAFFAQALAGAAVAAALWAPQLTTMLHQVPAGGLAFGALAQHVGLALWQLPAQATVGPQIEGWQSNLAAALVWAWAIAVFCLGWQRLTGTILPFFAVPSILTASISLATHKSLYDGKYHLLWGYALAAWTAVAYDAFAQRWRPAAATASALVLALAVTGVEYAFNPFFYTADWPRVAQIVRTHAQPGDLLILEPSAGNYGLEFYLDEHPYRLLPVTTPAEIAHAQSAILRERRVWLIGAGIVGVDPQLLLVHELQSRFRLDTFAEITRVQPNQDVQVGLFVRGAPR